MYNDGTRTQRESGALPPRRSSAEIHKKLVMYGPADHHIGPLDDHLIGQVRMVQNRDLTGIDMCDETTNVNNRNGTDILRIY